MQLLKIVIVVRLYAPILKQEAKLLVSELRCSNSAKNKQVAKAKVPIEHREL